MSSMSHENKGKKPPLVKQAARRDLPRVAPPGPQAAANAAPQPVQAAPPPPANLVTLPIGAPTAQPPAGPHPGPAQPGPQAAANAAPQPVQAAPTGPQAVETRKAFFGEEMVRKVERMRRGMVHSEPRLNVRVPPDRPSRALTGHQITQWFLAQRKQRKKEEKEEIKEKKEDKAPTPFSEWSSEESRSHRPTQSGEGINRPAMMMMRAAGKEKEKRMRAEGKENLLLAYPFSEESSGESRRYRPPATPFSEESSEESSG